MNLEMPTRVQKKETVSSYLVVAHNFNPHGISGFAPLIFLEMIPVLNASG
jgi:hypothetical protein